MAPMPRRTIDRAVSVSACPTRLRPELICLLSSGARPRLRLTPAPGSTCLPGRARRPVLEHDALLAKPRPDGVGLAKVASRPGLVAGGDGGLDGALVEPGARDAAGAELVEQRGRLRGRQADPGTDARQLRAHRLGLRTITGVERAIEVADPLEGESHRLRGVQVVVHGLAEGRLEGGEVT